MKADKQKQVSLERILDASLSELQEEGQTLERLLARAQQQESELKSELEAAVWLHDNQNQFDPRPGFVVASQSRLLARICAQRPTATTGFPRFLSPAWLNQRYTLREFALRAFMMALVIGFLLLNAVRSVQASYTCLPGDFFYPLKIALEHARLAGSLSAAGDAQLHIQYTRARLMEIQALTFEGRYEAIPGTVADFEGHVYKALAAIDRVAARDRFAGQALADNFQSMLTAHGDLLRLMVGFAPLETRSQFDHVRLISEDSASELREIFAPDGGDARIGLANAVLPVLPGLVRRVGLVAQAAPGWPYILERRVEGV